jgi:hypothetical protein
MDIPNREKIIRLIREAIQHILALGRQDELALLPVFKDTLTVFDVAPYNRSSRLLLLSAANQHITKAEKKTVSTIIGDLDFSINEMSHLVRIRLICAELVNLINQGLEEVRSR